MAITNLEIVNYLYDFLKTSPLMTDSKKPSGGLHKLKRPQNSTSEDVVINTLGANRGAVQKGVLLVNVYVPNLDPLKFTHLNNDRSQPDTARLLYLAKLVQSSLPNEVWANDGSYALEITDDSVFEDENNQHYVGFRIDFFTIK